MFVCRTSICPGCGCLVSVVSGTHTLAASCLELALVIREGKLKLIVRGRKRREVSLAEPVADGSWRSVSVRVSRARLVLSAGGAAATARAPPSSRSQRLYVGGVPQGLPNLPNSILRAGGFVGCVRHVMLGGRTEDLVRDAARHHRVGQCFPNVERAAYLGGDAYATWSTKWSVRGVSEVSSELRIQFRTAEPNGVLLAASGLVLELKDATLILTRYSATGSELSRAESRGTGGRPLCDDAWHAVVARVSGTHVALTLDAGPELRGTGDGTLLDDGNDVPVPAAPLYVGGLPEGLTDTPDGGRENFKGCIRDVSIGGHKTDWPNMEALHNVLLDSCPVQQ